MPTTPLGIVSPDGTNNYDLTVHLAAMGVSIDSAIQKYGNVQKGTATQRASAGATAPNGALWVDTDGTKMLWRRDSTVTGNWAPAVMRWRGTTTQMNAFTQAPDGFEWFNSTDNSGYTRVAGAWQRPQRVLVATGDVVNTIVISAGSQQVFPITFPPGLFTEPPSLTVGGNFLGYPFTGAVTKDGASIGMANRGASTISVGGGRIAWTAIQVVS